MKPIAIIGPSHAKQLQLAQKRGELPAADGIYIRGYQSAPIYSQYILDEMHYCKDCKKIFLYVCSSLRFNFRHDEMHKRLTISHSEHDASFKRDARLFHPGLLKNAEVVSRTSRHLRLWLEWYRDRYPQVRFVFWCDYMSFLKQRARRRGPTVPRDGYHAFRRDHPECVDIEEFQDRTQRPWRQLLQADQLHKNALGRKMFVDYLLGQVYERSSVKPAPRPAVT